MLICYVMLVYCTRPAKIAMAESSWPIHIQQKLAVGCWRRDNFASSWVRPCLIQILTSCAGQSSDCSASSFLHGCVLILWHMLDGWLLLARLRRQPLSTCGESCVYHYTMVIRYTSWRDGGAVRGRTLAGSCPANSVFRPCSFGLHVVPSNTATSMSTSTAHFSIHHICSLYVSRGTSLDLISISLHC